MRLKITIMLIISSAQIMNAAPIKGPPGPCGYGCKDCDLQTTRCRSCEPQYFLHGSFFICEQCVYGTFDTLCETCSTKSAPDTRFANCTKCVTGYQFDTLNKCTKRANPVENSTYDKTSLGLIIGFCVGIPVFTFIFISFVICFIKCKANRLKRVSQSRPITNNTNTVTSFEHPITRPGQFLPHIPLSTALISTTPGQPAIPRQSPTSYSFITQQQITNLPINSMARLRQDRVFDGVLLAQLPPLTNPIIQNSIQTQASSPNIYSSSLYNPNLVTNFNQGQGQQLQYAPIPYSPSIPQALNQHQSEIITGNYYPPILNINVKRAKN